MSSSGFPITLEGVTLRIEQLRREAGRDAERLAALSLELERELCERAPDDPLLARYAREILGNYRLMAHYGIFPEVFGDEEL